MLGSVGWWWCGHVVRIFFLFFIALLGTAAHGRANGPRGEIAPASNEPEQEWSGFGGGAEVGRREAWAVVVVMVVVAMVCYTRACLLRHTAGHSNTDAPVGGNIASQRRAEAGRERDCLRSGARREARWPWWWCGMHVLSFFVPLPCTAAHGSTDGPREEIAPDSGDPK